MRIGIDARYVYDHFPGIGRYVYCLAAALAELEHGHTLVLLHNPALPASRHNLADLRRFPSVELVPTGARPFSAVEQVALPALASALRLDLLHSPYYLKPFFGLPCPSVVTIFDLIGRRFPRLLPLRARLLFNLAITLALRTSAHVFTTSTSARNDIAYYYRLPKQRISVTPLAADRRFSPQPAAAVAAMRQRYNLPPRYVLFLGSNKPHKNLERLVRAWERLVEIGDWGLGIGDYQSPISNPQSPISLVIAGHYDPRYPEARRLVEERGLTSSVRFVANVAEEDLPALYSGAEVFVFPSYYEGFGLPPLEAMACGTPVLCAYASSLPEVVGNAAVTVDPFSSIEIAAELGRLLRHPGLRARLREQGLLRARTFSWRRTAMDTLAVYEQIAHAPKKKKV